MHPHAAATCLALGLLLSTTHHAIARPAAGDMQRVDVRIDAPFLGAGIDPATLAPPPPPPSAVPVDETRTITMLATTPSPCAAFATNNAVFYLSIQRLTALSDLKRQPAEAGKDVVDGMGPARAATLLKKLGRLKDANGCVTLQSAPDREEYYLLLNEIQSGAVHARTRDSGLPIQTVSVRYLGEVRRPRVGWGTIFLHLPGRDGEELTLPWWIF